MQFFEIIRHPNFWFLVDALKWKGIAPFVLRQIPASAMGGSTNGVMQGPNEVCVLLTRYFIDGHGTMYDITYFQIA